MTRMILRRLLLVAACLIVTCGAAVAQPMHAVLVDPPDRRVSDIAVSADGARVAWCRTDDTAPLDPQDLLGDIYVLDLRATTDRLLRRRVTTDGLSRSPSLSADGSVIAWLERGAGQYFVRQADVLGGVPTTMGTFPNWETPTSVHLSPDGASIAILTTHSRGATLRVMGRARFTWADRPMQMTPSGTVWLTSPDSIVVSLGLTDPTGRVVSWVVALAEPGTGRLTPVTCGSEDKLATVIETNPPSIAYVRRVKGPRAQTFLRTIKLGTPCSGDTLAADLGSMVVSSAAAAPDGSRVVVAADDGTGSDVYDVQLPYGWVTQLTSIDAPKPIEAAWPDQDGEMAFFVVRSDVGEGRIDGVNLDSPGINVWPLDASALPPFVLASEPALAACLSGGYHEAINACRRERGLIFYEEMTLDDGTVIQGGPWLLGLPAGRRAFFTTQHWHECYVLPVHLRSVIVDPSPAEPDAAYASTTY